MTLSDAKHWLERARKRFFDALYAANHIVREPGESFKHFQARRKKLRERRDHTEEIKDNLAKKVKHLEEKKDDHPASTGVGTFDGKQVAGWIIPWLTKSREHGWSGYVTSGYRSPEYSESLCYAMCGAPSCPGRCAGRASNHAGSVYPAGAVDVTDYDNFERIQFQIGSPLRNALPIDPVHFSISGH